MTSPGRDSVRVRAFADLDDLELVEATYVRHRFRPHYHETYLVGVTEGGAELFEARGARHASTPLSLRFHNPGEVHDGAPPPGGSWSYRCLYPSAALVAAVACGTRDSEAGQPWFPEMVVADPTLAEALVRACAVAGDGTHDIDLATSARLIDVLGAVLRRHARGLPAARPARRDPRTIARAQDYIAAHAGEAIRLGDLSAAVGLSRFHLVRAFGVQVGLTPSAFQAQVRVGRAKDLLRRGHPIGRVAAACGFHDSSHLARTFRAFVGVAPAAYRRGVAPRGGSHPA